MWGADRLFPSRPRPGASATPRRCSRAARSRPTRRCGRPRAALHGVVPPPRHAPRPHRGGRSRRSRQSRGLPRQPVVPRRLPSRRPRRILRRDPLRGRDRPRHPMTPQPRRPRRRKVHQQLSEFSALGADISDNCWWRYPHGLAAEEGAGSPVRGEGNGGLPLCTRRRAAAGGHGPRTPPGGSIARRARSAWRRRRARPRRHCRRPRIGCIPAGGRRTDVPRRSPPTRRRPRSRPSADGRRPTPTRPSPTRSSGPSTTRRPRCVTVRNRLGAAATGRRIRSSCSTSPGYRSSCARPTPRTSPRSTPRSGRAPRHRPAEAELRYRPGRMAMPDRDPDAHQPDLDVWNEGDMLLLSSDAHGIQARVTPKLVDAVSTEVPHGAPCAGSSSR